MHETFSPDDSERRTAEDTVQSDAEWCADELAGDLDRNRQRNVLQAVAVLVGIAVGAVIGVIFLPEAPVVIRALVGAVPGMLVGTFISGFVLMLVPAPTPMIRRSEYLRKYCRLRQIEPALLVASIASCVAMPVAIWLAVSDGGVLGVAAIIVWIVVSCPARACHMSVCDRLRSWKCPSCRNSFGFSGVFVTSPYSCQHCGFTVQ